MRDPGVRRPGGSGQAGLRRGEGRHMVVRRHIVRAQRRVPPVQRLQLDADVSEDLPRGVPDTEMDVAGAEEADIEAARHEPRHEDNGGGDHQQPVVQEGDGGGGVEEDDVLPLRDRGEDVQGGARGRA